jgi:NTE family protein
MRVGLVLGGGGLSGLAFHAGALCAMEQDLGWDPRSAELIVGTSAGSVVGALLRSGVPASELAALASGAHPMSVADPTGRSGAPTSERRPLPPIRGRDLLRPLRIPHHSLVTATLRRPWRADPLATLMTLARDGRVDLTDHGEDLLAGIGDDWPDDPLWLCSTRQRDARRVVFGRDTTPSLRSAVVASCAIPGYFAPVDVDGERHVDGGLGSATNADVITDYEGELDLVVVSSPMSGEGLGLLGPDAWMRRFSGRRLRHETDGLRSAEIPTVVLQPGAEARPTMGINLMDDARMRRVVGSSFLDVGAQLLARRTRTLVAGLAARRARPR